MLNSSRFHGQIELRCHKISWLNCFLQTLKNAIRLVESRELPKSTCRLMSHRPMQRTMWRQSRRCSPIDGDPGMFFGRAHDCRNPVDSTKRLADIPVPLLPQDQPSWVSNCLSESDRVDRDIRIERQSHIGPPRRRNKIRFTYRFGQNRLKLASVVHTPLRLSEMFFRTAPPVLPVSSSILVKADGR